MLGICWRRGEVGPDELSYTGQIARVNLSDLAPMLIADLRFDRNWTDYRKQPIKAGVYTMRLAFQPADGKHGADVSEFQEFVILLSPKMDTSPNLMEPKKMVEASSDAIDSGHPGVFMLVPAKAATRA